MAPSFLGISPVCEQMLNSVFKLHATDEKIVGMWSGLWRKIDGYNIPLYNILFDRWHFVVKTHR